VPVSTLRAVIGGSGGAGGVLLCMYVSWDLVLQLLHCQTSGEALTSGNAQWGCELLFGCLTGHAKV
jgi:hypothetical protein